MEGIPVSEENRARMDKEKRNDGEQKEAKIERRGRRVRNRAEKESNEGREKDWLTNFRSNRTELKTRVRQLSKRRTSASARENKGGKRRPSREPNLSGVFNPPRGTDPTEPVLEEKVPVVNEPPSSSLFHTHTGESNGRFGGRSTVRTG